MKSTEPPAPGTSLGSDAADPSEPRLLTEYGSRVSHDVAIYVVGTASVLIFSIASLAVYTRFLEPSEFGELAILFTFASFLTIFFNLGSLQGTLMWVFGGGEEDDLDSDNEGERVPTGVRRRALTTGVLLTAGVGALGALIIWPFAPSLERLLIGESRGGDTMMLAVATAALGSVWRLIANVPRQERRPVRFAILNNVRPLLALGCSIPLAAAGHGVDGILAGTAIGTAAALVVAIVVGRESYGFGVVVSAVPSIMVRGLPRIPVIIGSWIIQSGDVIVLAMFATNAEVGVYRVASRIGAFGSYFVSGFLMGYSPLERSMLFKGTYERHGYGAVKGIVTTYFTVLGLGLVLGMALAGDALVKIAPSDYSGAASIIPIIGLATIVHGAYILFIRGGRGFKKDRVYPGLTMLCALIFVGLALLLIPPLDSYGVALAAVIAWSVGMVTIWALIRRGRDPFDFEYGKIAATLATAAACFGAGRLLSPLAGDFGPAVDAAAFLLYPLLLIAFGVVPREHTRPLLRIMRSALPQRRRHDDLLPAMHDLDHSSTAALEVAIRHEHPVGELAALTGLSEQELRRRVVSSLRAVSDVGQPRDVDADIGYYLLEPMAPAERDSVGRALLAEGSVAPLELHELETALDRLRRFPDAAWSAIRPAPLSPRLAELGPAARSTLELVVRHGRRPDEIATLAGTSEGAVRSELGRTIAMIAGVPVDSPEADRVGRWLLSEAGSRERESLEAELTGDGVDAGDLVVLRATFARLRSLSERAWSASNGAGGWHSRPLPDFRPIADSFRREVLRFYDSRGESLEGAAGHNTLETNSGFAERRGRPLLEILRRRAGFLTLERIRLLDVGCGFGALSAFFASRGAAVTAVDPNDDRFEVGRAVAAEHELDIEFRPGQAQSLDVPDASFDAVVMNNSLCYIVDRAERQQALAEARRVLRPGGWLVIRNPNRAHPMDQFTRLPLVHRLPPRIAVRAAGLLGRRRSLVRLLTPRGARRELRRAGFDLVTLEVPGARGWHRRLAGFARYQHLTACRPVELAPAPVRRPAPKATPAPEAPAAPKAKRPKPAKPRKSRRKGDRGRKAGDAAELGVAPLFIGGCPRSGAGPLAGLLNEDERIIVAEERYKHIHRRVGAQHFGEGFFEPRDEETDVLDSDVYASLREKWAGGGVQLLGDQLPDYVYDMHKLAGRMPTAKFIVVKRELESVASAFNARAAAQDPDWPETTDYRVAVKQWNKSLAAARAFVEEHGGGDRLFLVDSDLLFGGDRAHLEQLYGFLGLDVPTAVNDRLARSVERWSKRAERDLQLDRKMVAFLARRRDQDAERWASERVEGQAG